MQETVIHAHWLIYAGLIGIGVGAFLTWWLMYSLHQKEIAKLIGIAVKGNIRPLEDRRYPRRMPRRVYKASKI